MKTSHARRSAFTLTELMVGMGVLVVMFGFLMTATNQMVRTMGNATSKVDQFRGARDAFERITSRLQQATLNTYWDYGGYAKDDVKRLRPTRYERRSELRFVAGPVDVAKTGFSALPGNKLGHGVIFCGPLGQVSNNNPVGVLDPRGLEGLLNVTGWYLQYGEDTDFRPKFIGSEVPSRWRWRLMEYSVPAEYFSVYKLTSGPATGLPNSDKTDKTWIVNWPKAVRPVVENIVALVITPRLPRTEEIPLQAGNKDFSPLAPNYAYDSMDTNADSRINPRHQLPPVMQVTMVAIDEKSAQALGLDSTSKDLFGVSGRFKDTKDFSKDLYYDTGGDTSLEGELIKRRVAYRVFTSNVHIRASKWSREQSEIKN